MVNVNELIKELSEMKLFPKTALKLKKLEVELESGKLENKPWVLYDEEKDEEYVLVDAVQYKKLLDLIEDILENTFDLKLEKYLSNEMPIDMEDAKLVVKKVMDENNIGIVEAIEKVKKNYPNLFFKNDMYELLNEIFV